MANGQRSCCFPASARFQLQERRQAETRRPLSTDLSIWRRLFLRQRGHAPGHLCFKAAMEVGNKRTSFLPDVGCSRLHLPCSGPARLR